MILAVAGGKGGVGKTTVAYNLAAGLDRVPASEIRGPSSELTSVVVDGDLGMANLPNGPVTRSGFDGENHSESGNPIPGGVTDTPPGPNLHDVLAGHACPRETVRSGPVDIVPCGRSLAGASAADLGELAAALATLEREYDVVVVDCPAGMRADVGVPLALADACVLVVSPRRFALADAIRTRELARELGAGLAGIAVNRVLDTPPVAAIREALGAPVTVIPTDASVAESVSSERPVVETARNSAGANGIRSLARLVAVV